MDFFRQSNRRQLNRNMTCSFWNLQVRADHPVIPAMPETKYLKFAIVLFANFFFIPICDRLPARDVQEIWRACWQQGFYTFILEFLYHEAVITLKAMEQRFHIYRTTLLFFLHLFSAQEHSRNHRQHRTQQSYLLPLIPTSSSRKTTDRQQRHWDSIFSCRQWFRLGFFIGTNYRMSFRCWGTLQSPT